MNITAGHAIVLLSSDLMLESQVEAAASSLQMKLVTASDASTAVDAALSDSVHTLVVDLTHPQSTIEFIVRDLGPQRTCRLIAFGPHVHQARLEAAKAAGFDLVLTRGQFHSRMKSWLTKTDGNPASGETSTTVD